MTFHLWPIHKWARTLPANRLPVSPNKTSIYWNRGHPDNESQSDGRIETIDFNIFKSSQSNVTFSIPANQMFGTRQWNINSFIVMLMQLQCRINYTCQLFLRYRREIFILGVLGFLKMTRSFPKIPPEVWSLPQNSEVPVAVLRHKRELAPTAFHFKNQRSRGRYITVYFWRYCHLFILHMVFVPCMGLS